MGLIGDEIWLRLLAGIGSEIEEEVMPSANELTITIKDQSGEEK